MDKDMNNNGDKAERCESEPFASQRTQKEMRSCDA